MSTTLPSYSIMMEGRLRRSRGSVERQTAQSHPSVGTPMDVPLPSTVKVAFMFLVSSSLLSSAAGSGGGAWLRRPRERVGDFDVGHAQFVKTILQEVLFCVCEIAFGFFGDETERVDGLARADDIDLRLRALLSHQSKLHHGGHVKRGEEAFEGDLEIFRRVAAFFDFGIQIFGRLAVRGSLRVLLGAGWGRGHFTIFSRVGWHGCRGFFRGRRFCRSRRGRFRRLDFFRYVGTQLAVCGKQAAVGYFEAGFLFLLSHKNFLLKKRTDVSDPYERAISSCRP